MADKKEEFWRWGEAIKPGSKRFNGNDLYGRFLDCEDLTIQSVKVSHRVHSEAVLVWGRTRKEVDERAQIIHKALNVAAGNI